MARHPTELAAASTPQDGDKGPGVILPPNWRAPILVARDREARRLRQLDRITSRERHLHGFRRRAA